MTGTRDAERTRNVAGAGPAACRLEVEGLVVRYGSGRRVHTAVDRVDLAIPAGGTVGLVGESGCGKSAVAKAITGLVPIAGGSIRLDGRDFSSQHARDSKDYRRRVQMVFQDPFSSLNPRLTVLEQLGDALSINTAVARADRRSEASRLLGLVGLEAAALDSYPHQFSGGQRQRIAIARALAVGPEVLILDEVTSALDVSVQATILNLLRDLQDRLGLAYLFISHDLSIVRSMSSQVIVLYLARTVECAPTDELFHNPRHPYTRSLIASIPRLCRGPLPAPLGGDPPDPHDVPSGCRFRTRCPAGPERFPERTMCSHREPARFSFGSGHWAACHFLEDPAALEAPAPAAP